MAASHLATVPVLRMTDEAEFQLFHRAVRYWAGQRASLPNINKKVGNPRDEQIIEYARTLVRAGAGRTQRRRLPVVGRR